VERRTAEIAEELAQEPARRQRLAELERQLENVSAARVAKAAAVEAMKSTRVAVEQQRTVVKSLDSVLAASRSRLEELARRQSDRTATRDTLARTVDQAAEIETSFKKWSTARVELQRLDQIASKFHQREQERLPLVSAIESEKARLLEEQRQLVARGQQVAAAQHDATSLRPQVDAAREALRHTEQSLQAQTDLQARQAANREELAARNAENEALRSEMDQIRSRLDALQEASGASCPLCGQPLSDEHRTATLNSLEAEGKQRGDRFRLNRSRAQELESDMARIESELAPLDQSAEERSERISALTKLTARMDSLLELQNDWAGTGAKRLEELTVVLSGGTFAQTARTRLAALDAELAKLGYDAAAHDQLRQDEQGLRGAEESHRALREAQAALAPLDKELADLETEVSTLRQEMNGREQEAADARNALAEAEAALPDLARAEKEAIDLREKENSVHQELGAARQRVDVLADLRLRELELGTARDTLALDIARHKRLERAFGKDGVPALLIEQALPEIESRANDLLDRLSDGQMSVHFVTQAGYKNKRREDLRETLDIQISDGAGQRDYELYSGGEAFRINFAIRLALSQVLAARKGARLQTLVIDEGFGSQDARGRQRLIEAINLVKGDFEKILVITHLEELKDAFPARIEVEKTDRGSAVRLN
jgi:exonuclease SbcC